MNNRKHTLKHVVACAVVVFVAITATIMSGVVGIELPEWSEVFVAKASAVSYGTSGFFDYYVEDGKATILSYLDQTSHATVIIPSSVGGYPVAAIGDEAFVDNGRVIKVTIPDSVTMIGSYAFSGCYNLESVTIPDSVTIIGSYAFSGCCDLESVTLPDSVTSIGEGAFYNCSGLKNVTIPDNVTSVGYGAFEETAWYDAKPNGDVYIGHVYYRYKGTMPVKKSIVIKDGTTSISDCAFKDYTRLKSITLPDSVTSIGDYAFYNCTGLTSITIPDNVTSIGVGAFHSCIGLKNVTIPDSVTSIGDEAFSFTAWYDAQPDGDVYIGRVYYRYKGTMPDETSIVIREGTKAIADSAFHKCTGLTSITIPDSVTSIGSHAFSCCSGLTSVTIGSSVTSIASGAFSYCSGLTSVTIGNSVTNIDLQAFYKCTGLTSITIPDSVTSIGSHAFSYCSGLTSVTIPDSVTSIGYYAFGSCTNLASVTIGNSVTSIGSKAFGDCTRLTRINWNAENVSDFNEESSVFYNAGTIKGGIDVVFGDNVKNIPAYVVYVSDSKYRPKIKSVTIGAGVTSISDYAFYECTGLTKINWNAENVKDFSSWNSVFYNAGTDGDGIDVVFGDNVKYIPA